VVRCSSTTRMPRAAFHPVSSIDKTLRIGRARWSASCLADARGTIWVRRGLEPFAARSIQVQAPCGRAGAAGASGRPALGTISAESSDDVDAVDGNHVFAVFLVDRRHEFKAHAGRTYASVPPSLGDDVPLTQLSGVRQTVTNESLHKVAHKNNSSSGREGRSCSIRRPVTLACVRRTCNARFTQPMCSRSCSPCSPRSQTSISILNGSESV
jgi:hypothetical protein